MRFLKEAVYCMTWIWTLHRAHNKLKSPIKEDNVWATLAHTCIRMLILSIYVLLECINTIYKYGHAWMI